MDGNDAAAPASAGKCPFVHGGATSLETTAMDWWPKALNLDILHQHDTRSAATSTTASTSRRCARTSTR